MTSPSATLGHVVIFRVLGPNYIYSKYQFGFIWSKLLESSPHLQNSKFHEK